MMTWLDAIYKTKVYTPAGSQIYLSTAYARYPQQFYPFVFSSCIPCMHIELLRRSILAH